MKIIAIVLSMSFILSIAGCSQKDVVTVSAINLSHKQIEIAEGEEYTLYAEVYPENAVNSKVEWKSSDEDVATVAKGTIRALSTGSCKVYATNTDGSISVVCDVVVGDAFLRVNQDYSSDKSGYGVKYFGSINEAVAASQEGDAIIVEKGEYDEIVNITKSVVLKGQDAVMNGQFIIGYPKQMESVEEITIEGFQFNVSDSYGMNQMASIYIGNDVDDVTVSNCKFVGNPTETAVTETETDSAGTSEGDPKWLGEEVLMGIVIVPSASKSAVKELEILNNVFENLDYALMFMPYVSESKIMSNTFTDCGYAMRLCGSKRVDIENNELNGSGFIQFGYAENLADMINIENNTINSYGEGNFIEAKEGTVNKGLKIDLSKNTFMGVSSNDMEKDEFDVLVSKIEGIENDGIVKNIKIMDNKYLKKLLEATA